MCLKTLEIKTALHMVLFPFYVYAFMNLVNKTV